MPHALAPGATLIDYGAQLAVPISGVTFAMQDEPPPQDVPEPASLAVLAVGLFGLAGAVRYRRRPLAASAR